MITSQSGDASPEEKKSHDLENRGEDTPEGEEPNEYEKQHLRRVGENLPASAFLIAIVELCERFTYYGCQGLFQNYISNSPNGDDGTPGLGLGHQGATGLNVFFQFFCYGVYWAPDRYPAYRSLTSFPQLRQSLAPSSPTSTWASTRRFLSSAVSTGLDCSFYGLLRFQSPCKAARRSVVM